MVVLVTMSLSSIPVTLSVMGELSVEWFGSSWVGVFTGNKQVFFFITYFEVW